MRCRRLRVICFQDFVYLDHFYHRTFLRDIAEVYDLPFHRIRNVFTHLKNVALPVRVQQNQTHKTVLIDSSVLSVSIVSRRTHFLRSDSRSDASSTSTRHSDSSSVDTVSKRYSSGTSSRRCRVPSVTVSSKIWTRNVQLWTHKAGHLRNRDTFPDQLEKRKSR